MDLRDGGVSSAIGTILLIAMVLVIAGGVGYVFLGKGTPEPAPSASLSAEATGEYIYIDHDGGDTIADATKDLLVKLNGKDIDPENITVGGSENNLKTGDSMEISVDFSKGDKLKVIHKPSNSILLESTIEKSPSVQNRSPSPSLSVESPVLTDELSTINASGSSDPDGSVSSYDFDFTNDGTYEVTGGSDGIVEHSYADDGTYTVKVRVTDDDGVTSTTTADITVNNRSPSASFTHDGPKETNVNVNFDATGSSDQDGSIDNYEWDWTNDGTYDASGSSLTKPGHSYPDDGTYTVKLRVTDDDGAMDTVTQTVTVSEPNDPPTVENLQSSNVDMDSADLRVGVADSDGDMIDVGFYDNAWADNLVGWWPMETEEDNTVWDWSGQGNDGTMNGGMTADNYTPGQFGSGLKFDGTDDYVEVPSDASLNLDGNSFTLSAWINGDILADFGVFSKKGSESYGEWLQCSVKTDKIEFDFYSSAVFGSYDFSTETWYFVTFRYDTSSDNGSVWVNGNKINSEGMTELSNTNSAPLVIGAIDSTSWADGKIDEARVYNRALSKNEIGRIYNSTYIDNDVPSGSTASVQWDNLTAGDSYGFSAIAHDGVSFSSESSVQTCTVSPSPMKNWNVSSNNDWYNNALSSEVDVRTAIDSGSLKLTGENAAGWWSMDDATDNTVYDLTSLGNDGTMNGGMGTDNYVSGEFGTALDFDGTDDYVNVGTLGDFGSGLELSTYSFWGKWSTSEEQTALGFNEGLFGAGLRLKINPSNGYVGGLDTHIKDASFNDLQVRTDDENANDGNWHHWVIAVDSANNVIDIYKDGVAVDTIPVTSENPSAFENLTTDVFIGAFNNEGTAEDYSGGSIDELQIYDTYLSENQIKRICNRTKPSSMTGSDLKTGTWTSTIWDSEATEAQQISSFETNATIGADEEVLVRIGVDEDDDGTIDTWSHDSGNGVSLSDGTNTLGDSDFNLPSGYRYQVEYSLSVTDSEITHSPSVQSYELKVG